MQVADASPFGHLAMFSEKKEGPSVNGPIAMGYINKEYSKVDTKILLEVRGKKHPASVCGLPFYKKSYVKGVN